METWEKNFHSYFKPMNRFLSNKILFHDNSPLSLELFYWSLNLKHNVLLSESEIDFQV